MTGLSIVSALRVDDNEVVSGSGGIKADSRSVDWSNMSRKLAKSKNRAKSRYLGNSNNLGEHKFLISRARKAFNCLR